MKKYTSVITSTVAAPILVKNKSIAHIQNVFTPIYVMRPVEIAITIKPKVNNSFSPNFLSAIFPRGICIKTKGKSIIVNIKPMVFQLKPIYSFKYIGVYITIQA